MSKIKLLLENKIIATLLLICIYCQPMNTTEDVIKDDNFNYAPLQIGNQWIYIATSFYHNARDIDSIGNFQYRYIYKTVVDTILIVVDNIINVGGDSLFILTQKQVSFDSTVYISAIDNVKDTLILSKVITVNFDTLRISGDSIKGLYPYFDLINLTFRGLR